MKPRERVGRNKEQGEDSRDRKNIRCETGCTLPERVVQGHRLFEGIYCSYDVFGGRHGRYISASISASITLLLACRSAPLSSSQEHVAVWPPDAAQ